VQEAQGPAPPPDLLRTRSRGGPSLSDGADNYRQPSTPEAFPYSHGRGGRIATATAVPEAMPVATAPSKDLEGAPQVKTWFLMIFI
jgi:hypothetical protein